MTWMKVLTNLSMPKFPLYCGRTVAQLFNKNNTYNCHNVIPWYSNNIMVSKKSIFARVIMLSNIGKWHCKRITQLNISTQCVSTVAGWITPRPTLAVKIFSAEQFWFSALRRQRKHQSGAATRSVSQAGDKELCECFMWRPGERESGEGVFALGRPKLQRPTQRNALFTSCAFTWCGTSFVSESGRFSPAKAWGPLSSAWGRNWRRLLNPQPGRHRTVCDGSGVEALACRACRADCGCSDRVCSHSLVLPPTGGAWYRVSSFGPQPQPALITACFSCCECMSEQIM